MPSVRVQVVRLPVTPVPDVVESPGASVRGGQFVANAPMQTLAFGESFLKEHGVIPSLPVRGLPRSRRRS